MYWNSVQEKEVAYVALQKSVQEKEKLVEADQYLWKMFTMGGYIYSKIRSQGQ